MNQIKNILVAVDLTPEAERVVEAAAAIAGAFSSRVWIVHVAAPNPEFVGYEAGPDAERHHRAVELRQEHRGLQALANKLKEQGIDATALLVEGFAVEKIPEEAKRLSADLLVIGGRKHGVVYRTLIGSVHEGIIRQARHPVLIVPLGSAPAQ